MPGPRLVVFACGNVSRGDDAIGPELLARIEALRPPDVTAIEDFQLQIEHALDLDGAGLALFIDAGTGTPSPFSFYEAFPGPTQAHSTHALEPAAVLGVYANVNGRPPPPAFVLCVRGESFELGAGLSEPGARNLERAWRFLGSLLKAPDAEVWRSLAKG